MNLLGPDAYLITSHLVAWVAGELAQGNVKGSGALGPVDAFGLDRVETACAEAGFRRLRREGLRPLLVSDLIRHVVEHRLRPVPRPHEA